MGTLLVICRGVGAMSLDYVECSYFVPFSVICLVLRIQGHINICKSYKFMNGKDRAVFCLKGILEFLRRVRGNFSLKEHI